MRGKYEHSLKWYKTFVLIIGHTYHFHCVISRDRHNMLLIFPIILCSNSRGYHLLCFAFLPIMLESMIDINVKKQLETMDLLIPTQFRRARALQSIE